MSADSTIVRAYQHLTNTTHPAGGWFDGDGLPLVTVITDSVMLLPMLEQLRLSRPVGRARKHPSAFRGDKRVLVPRDPVTPA